MLQPLETIFFSGKPEAIFLSVSCRSDKKITNVFGRNKKVIAAR